MEGYTVTLNGGATVCVCMVAVMVRFSQAVHCYR